MFGPEAKNFDALIIGSPDHTGTEGARSTAEVVNAGVFGPVGELRIWCDHSVYPCLVVRPSEAETPPADLDRDLWQGPAPHQPYDSAYQSWRWRPWWDFGGGTVGDMACHTFHWYFHELELGAPEHVYGYGAFRREGVFGRVRHALGGRPPDIHDSGRATRSGLLPPAFSQTFRPE